MKKIILGTLLSVFSLVCNGQNYYSVDIYLDSISMPTIGEQMSNAQVKEIIDAGNIYKGFFFGFRLDVTTKKAKYNLSIFLRKSGFTMQKNWYYDSDIKCQYLSKWRKGNNQLWVGIAKEGYVQFMEIPDYYK